MIATKTNINDYNIAWQGWRIPVAADWQPMRITGDHKNGAMIIGSSDAPILQVSWHRLKGRDMTASAWLKRRFRNIPESILDGCPKPTGFDDVGWFRNMELKEDNSKSVWVGVSNSKKILIDIMFTNLSSEAEREKIINECLPQLEVFGKEENWPWNIYQVSFSVPGDYILKKHHLYSGDIALEFQRKSGDTLMVRQVYPSKLALSRRTLKRWLEEYPFHQKRKYKLDDENDWGWDGMNKKGLKRFGRKQIPFPFGWIRRRHCSSFIVQDEEMDRLLIAEHACTEGTDNDMLENIITGMNQDNV